MSDEVQELKARVKQLEAALKSQSMYVPPKPDPNLAPDEWYAIFSDFQNTTEGIITKVPWQGGSNMTAVYTVKRIR